jgi:hypothetical protein
MFKRMWNRHPVLTTAFALALLATVFFGARATMFAVTLSKRAEQPVAAWMTPRYVVRTYHLPRETVIAVLGLDEGNHPQLTISAIARMQGRPVREILDDLNAAVAEAGTGPDGVAPVGVGTP